MKTINPSNVKTLFTTPDQYRWAQSIHKAINGGMSMGEPDGKVPDGNGINSGVYSQFNKGNGSGVLIRISAYGALGTGADYNWPATANTGIPIFHTLKRQPIGFHVVDVDKDARIYRTAVPDDSQLTLATTDPSCSVTVYVF